MWVVSGGSIKLHNYTQQQNDWTDPQARYDVTSGHSPNWLLDSNDGKDTKGRCCDLPVKLVIVINEMTYIWIYGIYTDLPARHFVE